MYCISNVDWIRIIKKKEEKKGDHQNREVRGEVRGSRFESNFMICMKLLESQRRSNIIRRERKVFPPHFALILQKNVAIMKFPWSLMFPLEV